MNFSHLGIIETNLDDLNPYKEAEWTNYPKGVIRTFEEHGCKCDTGLDILIYGDIPDGAGRL